MGDPIIDRTSGAEPAEKLANILRQRIFGAQYSSGERLPAERQLAVDFSASRATVRQALRLLERSNLIVRRKGSGTYVKYDTRIVEDDVAEVTSPLELIDVRRAVEPQIVCLAVLRMAARDLVGLKEAVDALEQVRKDKELFSSWDQVFHMRIAEATRNPLMTDIYRRINHVRGHEQWNFIKNRKLTEERMAAYNSHHREIFEALQARDAERAVAAVNHHLNEARIDLTRGM